MKNLFTAEMFTATRFDTAEEKAKFANHFVRFVESGFKETMFQKWFYNRLSMTFGHIAHYNQSGFYGTFFCSTQDILSFLVQTVSPWTNFAGDPKFTYCDVEKKLAEWVVKEGLVERYRQKVADETREAEINRLKQLIKKYPEVVT